MATTETGYAVTPIGDTEQGEVRDGRVQHRIRAHFGIEAFGVNAFRAVEAGARLINEHIETGVGSNGQEELYVVLTGSARFTLDGDEIDAPAGTLVYARPNVKRGAIANEPDTTVLALGGTAGVAYNQSPSFLVAPMFGPYGEEDFAAAAAIVRDVLAEHPGLPLALYNLACCESRLEERDAAFEHLAQAIAGESGFAEFAKTDSDFDPIREDPRFAALLSNSS